MPRLQSRFRYVARLWQLPLLECNNAECGRARRAWRRFSDGAKSIQLHGERYCFPDCFEQEVQRRFAEMSVFYEPAPRASHRVPLGLLMLSRGDLTNVQLRQVIDAQRDSGRGRIGEWVRKLAGEHQVTAALALQWSCPTLKVLPPCAAECGIPLHLLKQFCMAPVHFLRTSRVLHVAFGHQIEYRVLHAIEQMLECKTEGCLTTPTALELLLENMERPATPSEKLFDGRRGPKEMAGITSSYAAKLLADEVRTVSCAEFIWVRIKGGRGTADLLFPLTDTQLLPAAKFSP